MNYMVDYGTDGQFYLGMMYEKGHGAEKSHVQSEMKLKLNRKRKRESKNTPSKDQWVLDRWA